MNEPDPLRTTAEADGVHPPRDIRSVATTEPIDEYEALPSLSGTASRAGLLALAAIGAALLPLLLIALVVLTDLIGDLKDCAIGWYKLRGTWTSCKTCPVVVTIRPHPASRFWPGTTQNLNERAGFGTGPVPLAVSQWLHGGWQRISI